MMTQGELPFKYEEDKSKVGMTGLGGIGLYLDLMSRSGMVGSIEGNVEARTGGQGWTDAEVVLSLVILNLVGGDSVEDLERLECDEGLCALLSKSLSHGLSRKGRRQLKGRWRKAKKRSVPSASSVFRYLSSFHEEEEERGRVAGKAYIPQPTEALKGLRRVCKEFIGFVQENHEQGVATLDMDATLVETGKRDALWSYKGFRAYQPLNVYWAEQDVVVHSEFRDGNVPAGFEQRRVLEEALEQIPRSVQRVRMRSDSAGYQHELLKYCDRAENKWCGRIEFTVSCDVSPEFKAAVGEAEDQDWKMLMKRDRWGNEYDSGRQWAEVCFVPSAIGKCKNGPEYRYLAIREPMQDQLCFEGMEEDQCQYAFPTMAMKSGKYKVFGIVTNMDWDGQELIGWHHKRCGKSEEAHSVMKEDLAGGRFPSGDFGENAAWWWIMILAFNLNAAMKQLVLGGRWVNKRMKAIRFSLIHLAGRVIAGARQLKIKLSGGRSSYEWMIRLRAKILQLVPSPSG
jgi:hypothetical protein